MEIRKNEFLSNTADAGGVFFFMFHFPYESPEKIDSIFEKNIGKSFGNNVASLPFRFVLLMSNDDSFDFNQILATLNPIRIKPGKKFDLNFKLFSIDQFNQNALSLVNNE